MRLGLTYPMANKRAHSEVRSLPEPPSGKVGAPQATSRSPRPDLRKLATSPTPAQRAKLRARLESAEETLRAIQSGEVDALMVSGRRGEQVLTLKGAEPAYRMLVEAMSEGAATLSRDGAVLYCNRGFAEMMGMPPRKILGMALSSLVVEAERDRFAALLKDARKTFVKGEFSLCRKAGGLIPVYLSLNRFRGFEGQALGLVITDLSEQKRKQAEEVRQAEAVHRLLLERTLSAQEEERRRIARELHDEAGQLLTALLVGLRSLEDARKLADVREQGHRLRDIATQAIDEVGRLARGLHPTVLEDHGLGVALSRYAAEYTKSQNIAVDLALNGIDFSNMPSAAQIALYRILQEALTNVARHSGAKAVSIRFASLAKAIEVEVLDDGCGFDAHAVAVSSHRLGIQSMRERAAMLGGTIRFISQPKGTRILVQVPLVTPTAQSLVEQRST